MAACGWHDEDGLRVLEIDFRGGDPVERSGTLRTACDQCEQASGRVLILVRWDSEGLDMGFLKEAKDANRRLRHVDARAAFLGLGAKGGALAAIFNVRVEYERVRSFDDESVARAWLEEVADGGR